MSTIDADKPQRCEFCRKGDPNESKAVLIPWEQDVGWWCCANCTDVAIKYGHEAMDKRRIISFKCLPRWFLEWGIFNVTRSNGDNIEMILMDFPCASNKNYGGRLAMSRTDKDPQIYIDMCSEDHSINKRATLKSLYESNPELTEQPILELSFPSFVSQENRHLWNAAIMAAMNAGQKKIAVMNLITDTDPSSETDCDEEVNGSDDEEVITGPDSVVYVVESRSSVAEPTIPVGEQPVGKQPASEQPVGEQPVSEQPASKQPVGEQPASEQPVGEQPVGEQPVGEQPVGEQPATMSEESGEDDDDVEKEGDEIHFEPLVKLEKVAVVTGEENETVLFESRAKLFRWDKGMQWKERGVGSIKVLEHRQTKKVRLLMRRDRVLCLNQLVTKELTLHAAKGSDKSFTWVAQDFSDDEPGVHKFFMRFETLEVAADFKAAVEAAVSRAVSVAGTEGGAARAAGSSSTRTTAPAKSEQPATTRLIELSTIGVPTHTSPAIRIPRRSRIDPTDGFW